jgi:ubiquinone/menaquinone biosynthesis C-methylase UbiE
MSLYYNGIADIYDATRAMPPEVDEQITEFILHLVAAKSDTKFLELGIGTGLNALPIIKRGYAYTGVDISWEMMEQLRHKLPIMPPNLTLIQADATSLAMFENNTFDVVLMRHMLHLVADWRCTLSEIRRVLKPNGFYLYCESKLTPHQQEFEQHWRSIIAQYEGFQSPDWEDADRAGIDEVKKWLIEHGATVETVNAARWNIEQSVGQLLDIYQTKSHGSCWQIPDAVFPMAMQDLRIVCQQKYGSEDFKLSSDAAFDITYIRW